MSIILYFVGIIPILAVAFSVAGLVTFRADEQSGRWMAVSGLVLGSLFTLAYMVAYRHLVL